MLQDWPIRLAHIVPPVVVALAKHPLVDGYDLSGVDWLFSGAAPLGAELTEAVETRLSLRVRQGYGMTEASPATHYTAPGRERPGRRACSCRPPSAASSIPRRGTDVGRRRTRRSVGARAAGDEGIPQQPGGHRATVDDDGWLHTGDIGVMDDEGYLEVVDRLKELIKVKGFQVAPAELEALLLKHPAIADAAVIPVPDAECGEVPKAVIVAREP